MPWVMPAACPRCRAASSTFCTEPAVPLAAGRTRSCAGGATRPRSPAGLPRPFGPAPPPRPCSSLSPRRRAEWASPPLYKSGWAAPRPSVASGSAAELPRGTSSCVGHSLPSSRLPPPCSHGLAADGDQPRGARGAAGTGLGLRSGWWDAVSHRHSRFPPRPPPPALSSRC